MKQNYILYAGSYAAAEEAGIHGYRLTRGEGGEPRLTELFARRSVESVVPGGFLRWPDFILRYGGHDL